MARDPQAGRSPGVSGSAAAPGSTLGARRGTGARHIPVSLLPAGAWWGGGCLVSKPSCGATQMGRARPAAKRLAVVAGYGTARHRAVPWLCPMTLRQASHLCSRDKELGGSGQGQAGAISAQRAGNGVQPGHASFGMCAAPVTLATAPPRLPRLAPRRWAAWPNGEPLKRRQEHGGRGTAPGRASPRWPGPVPGTPAAANPGSEPFPARLVSHRPSCSRWQCPTPLAPRPGTARTASAVEKLSRAGGGRTGGSQTSGGLPRPPLLPPRLWPRFWQPWKPERGPNKQPASCCQNSSL